MTAPTPLEIQKSNLLMGKRNLGQVTPTPIPGPTTIIPPPQPSVASGTSAPPLPPLMPPQFPRARGSPSPEQQTSVADVPDAYRVAPKGSEVIPMIVIDEFDLSTLAVREGRVVDPPIVNWNNWLADARAAIANPARNAVSIQRSAIRYRVTPLVTPELPSIPKTSTPVVNPFEGRR